MIQHIVSIRALAQFANGIPRGAGHSTIAAACASAANATLVVADAAMGRIVLQRHPGLKVATMADVAARKVAGPIIIDPVCFQELARIAGHPPIGDFDGETTGGILG